MNSEDKDEDEDENEEGRESDLKEAIPSLFLYNLYSRCQAATFYEPFSPLFHCVVYDSSLRCGFSS